MEDSDIDRLFKTKFHLEMDTIKSILQSMNPMGFLRTDYSSLKTIARLNMRINGGNKLYPYISFSSISGHIEDEEYTAINNRFVEWLREEGWTLALPSDITINEIKFRSKEELTTTFTNRKTTGTITFYDRIEYGESATSFDTKYSFYLTIPTNIATDMTSSGLRNLMTNEVINAKKKIFPADRHLTRVLERKMALDSRSVEDGTSRYVCAIYMGVEQEI